MKIPEFWGHLSLFPLPRALRAPHQRVGLEQPLPAPGDRPGTGLHPAGNPLPARPQRFPGVRGMRPERRNPALLQNPGEFPGIRGEMEPGIGDFPWNSWDFERDFFTEKLRGVVGVRLWDPGDLSASTEPQ